MTYSHTKYTINNPPVHNLPGNGLARRAHMREGVSLNRKVLYNPTMTSNDSVARNRNIAIKTSKNGNRAHSERTDARVLHTTARCAMKWVERP